MTIENGYVIFNTEDIKECFEKKEATKYENWMNYILDRIHKMNKDEYNRFMRQLDDVSFEILANNRIPLDAIETTFKKENSHMDRVNKKTGESEYDGFNRKTGNGWMTMLMIMTQEINESLSVFELNKALRNIDKSLKIVKNNKATHGVSNKAVSVEPDFIILKDKKATKTFIEMQVVTTTSDKEKNPLIFKWSKYKKYNELIRKGCLVYHVVKNIITDTNEVEYEIFNINHIFADKAVYYTFIEPEDRRAMGYCYKGEGKARGYATVVYEDKAKVNTHRTIIKT